MKTKTQKMLPKTINEIENGGVYSQRVRCGKSNCRCSNGITHTAFYFFTRRNGKLTKYYVPKSEVLAFTRLVDQAITRKREQKQISKQNVEMLKEFRLSLREKQAIINSIKGS